MVDVQDIARKLDADAGPALEAPARRSPPSSRKRSTKANRLIGSVNAGYGDDSRFRRDLDRLLPQLTDTARSIRALSRSAVAPSRGPDQGPHQHGQGMNDLRLGRRRFAWLSLRWPLAAAACGASPEPNYYTIVARNGPTFTAGPKVVLLKDIGLASYLDRREIVRSSESYKLDILANNWWGEPLGGLLGRILVVELSQRLPNSTVYGESGAITADPNCRAGGQHPAPRCRQGRRADPGRPGRHRVQPAAAHGGADVHLLQAARHAGHARAWWRRSATPSASWPTGSPPCCSG